MKNKVSGFCLGLKCLLACALQVLQLPTHRTSASRYQWTFALINPTKFHPTSKPLSATITWTATTSPTPALHPSCPTSNKQLSYPPSQLSTPCQHGVGDASTVIQSIFQHFQFHSRCTRKLKWLMTLERR
jgi:hypothetical protein